MMILGSRGKVYKHLIPDNQAYRIPPTQLYAKLQGEMNMVDKQVPVKIDTIALGEQVERLQKLLPSLSIYNITLEDLELLVKIIKSNNKGK